MVADQENDDEAHNGQLTSTLNELRSLEDSLVQSIKSLEPAYHLSVAEEDMEKYELVYFTLGQLDHLTRSVI